jgi:DNA-binding CsgD family transcriptional regulator
MQVLTHREREVAEQARSGKTNAEIAKALGCAAGTVSVHLKSIFRKLECRNRTELAAIREEFER